MIRDALEWLAELKDEGYRPAVLNIPGEPANVFWTTKADGSLTRHDHTPPPPSNVMHTLDDLARLMNDVWNDTDDVDNKDGAVWIGDQAIEFVYGTNLLSRAHVKLPYSEPVMRLNELEKGKSFEQKALISFLGVQMARVRGTKADVLLTAARTVKWKRAEELESNLNAGNSSVGRKVMSEMQGATGIPEEITFLVPVFANPSIPKTELVTVAVELDLEKAAIRLTTLSGEMERLEFEGKAWVRQTLGNALYADSTSRVGKAAAGHPLYLGQFSK